MTWKKPDPETDKLLPIGIAATCLRVPRKWLTAECKAGRLPHLDAGGNLMVNLPLLRDLLADRASGRTATHSELEARILDLQRQTGLDLTNGRRVEAMALRELETAIEDFRRACPDLDTLNGEATT